MDTITAIRAQILSPYRQWQPATSCFPAGMLSTAQRQQVLDAGSTTQHLREQGHELNVSLQYQGWQQPSQSEAKSLHQSSFERAYVREVLLSVDEEWWMWARTLVPSTSLWGHFGTALCSLGETSLGDLLFASHSLQRSPFEFCHVTAPAAHWARRSLLHWQGHHLLLTEVFL